MAFQRRSRRLRGLAPEEDGIGVCVICQEDFSIEQLVRVVRTECCQTLFHRSCHQEMVCHSSRCAGCRHENEPENPRALELPEDNVSLEVFVDDLESPIRFDIPDTQGKFILPF